MQVHNYKLHLTQILLSILTTPIQHYGIEVFPLSRQGVEGKKKKLKRRQGYEGKRRS
jgi:hypothetical protein